MSLLALPPDMLRLVLSFLGTRSLLNAAATCTTLRDMVNAMALHPTMTSQTRMLHWLQRPTVAPRVRTLTARYCLWGYCRFVRLLTSLQQLVVTFGHVSAPICRHLPPTLEYLDLHRIDCEYGDVFLTSRLTRLPLLHTLKLSFTPHWDTVIVDGLDALPLRHLSLRLAPKLVVRGPMAVDSMHLHAVEALVCPFELTAEDLSLECTDAMIPLDIMVTPSTAPKLRRLSLSCPRRVTVPSLEHMTRLEKLRVRYDSALLPLRQLAAIPTLRSLVVDTRFGIAVSGMHAKLPGHVRVEARVSGVPMSPTSVRSMFYVAADGGKSACVDP